MSFCSKFVDENGRGSKILKILSTCFMNDPQKERKSALPFIPRKKGLAKCPAKSLHLACILSVVAADQGINRERFPCAKKIIQNRFSKTKKKVSSKTDE